MPIDHNKVHYLIGVAALALGLHGALREKPNVQIVSAAPGTEKHSQFEWPSLGQERTIALGEALPKDKLKKVWLFCDKPECRALMVDLDDAMQIGGVDDDFETRSVDSEIDKGVFVGPPGDAANALAAALKDTTGIDPSIVGIDGLDGGVGIIIGKR
jgi:hypothetical protein